MGFLATVFCYTSNIIRFAITKMLEIDSLSLPESHFNILQILSALAWSDGHLSSEEIELLLEEFKQDLPANPAPISSGQE